MHSVVDGTDQCPVQLLEGFFTSFTGFEYRPKQSASVQMKRLKKFMKKVYEKDDKNTKELKNLHRHYQTALVQQFNLSYGKDVDDLAAWHKLLRRCGIKLLPETSVECKKVRTSVITVSLPF